MEHRFAPAPGGGIEPTGPSSAGGRLPLLAARVVSGMMRLPAPLTDRLQLRLQRSTRPPHKIAGGTPISEEEHGGVPTTWLAPELRSEGAVVFFHGGSYSGGPFRGQWAWLAEIQRRTGLAAAMVRYRMPPTHPFPAALDDAVTAIRAMRASGVIDDGRWFLGGDSAGGGLALAAAQTQRDAGDPLPAGLVLTAPWVDLEMEHPDLLAQPGETMALGRSLLRQSAERYAAGVPLADRRLSPINGSMDGLPPVHVNVGTRDLFLPDIRRLRAAFDDVGVPVTSIEQEDATHTYPQQITTPEAEWTIRSQSQWIRERLSAGSL